MFSGRVERSEATAHLRHLFLQMIQQREQQSKHTVYRLLLAWRTSSFQNWPIDVDWELAAELAIDVDESAEMRRSMLLAAS